ncbi:MAG TPA: hypothetical protein VGS41_09230 [Chthonomonadales bacterium]|nr:hypothetical protein [Chthonomonadales bacterium]
MNSSSGVRLEAIGEAWRLMTQEMGTWVLSILVTGLILVPVYLIFFTIGMAASFSPVMHPTPMGAFPSAQAQVSGPAPLGVLIGYLYLFLMGCFLFAGLFRMAVRQVRGERINLADLFKARDVWLPFLGAYVLISIGTIVGMFLLFIPGLIVGGLTMLTYPIIADRRIGTIAAIQESMAALKSQWLMATAVYFLTTLVAGLGFLALGVGVLFTYPMLFLTLAVVYRDTCMLPSASAAQQR